MAAATTGELPDFVPPMLARIGAPFDSDAHLFEIKWDGTRAQARMPGGGAFTLTNRRRNDLTPRYPEFGFLATAAAGALVDGEIVVMRDGKPDFPLLLRREQARKDLRIRTLSRTQPAVFVAFDLLYADGQPILAEPLVTRRERLAQFVAAIDHPRLVLSDGVAGRGMEYFAAATARGLEGIMAKRLASRYEPGARTGDWLKVKQKHELLCAIVGGVIEDGDVRSLIIAAQLPAPGEADPGDPEGVPLRCVGRVGSGLTAATRARLHDLLATHRRETPFLPCKERGLWVEPGLYCKVSYLERTREGQLRAPVFLDLIVGA